MRTKSENKCKFGVNFIHAALKTNGGSQRIDGHKQWRTNVEEKKKFRIGGPDEALVLLWARGDEPEDIAAKFKIPVAEVEEAIQRHGHKYNRRPSPRPNRP
jgi:hypothetical protein